MQNGRPSKRIKQAHPKALLSQAAFVKELGVAYSMINRRENGKSKPNFTAMKAIKIFGENIAFCMKLSKRNGLPPIWRM